MSRPAISPGASRPAINYAERRAPVASPGFGYAADRPTAGHYRIRLVQNAVRVAVRIWFGPPHDPVDGAELDRHWRWQAAANGEAIDLDRVWPRCGGDPIDAAEHDHLVATHEWARLHDPASPHADPRKPIDLLTAPLPIF